MKVKVNPVDKMYAEGSEACISITPIKKHGRTYYMGCVMLQDVGFAETSVTGEVIFEAVERYRPDVVDSGRMMKVTPQGGRFFSVDGVDVTDGNFNAAVVVGNECFVSKEW